VTNKEANKPNQTNIWSIISAIYRLWLSIKYSLHQSFAVPGVPKLVTLWCH